MKEGLGTCLSVPVTPTSVLGMLEGAVSGHVVPAETFVKTCADNKTLSQPKSEPAA